MTEHGHEQGYSLMELLVVLLLMGFIAIAMTGGLRLGSRAWERSGEAVATSEEVIGAQSLLRTLVQRVIPRDLDPSIPADPALFTGTTTRMSFTALAPPSIDAAGVARFRLDIVRSGPRSQLRMAWTGAGGQRPTQPLVLFDGAGQIAFAYATRDQTGVLVWRDDWTGQSGAPALVAIRATGSRGRWPELLMRVRISRDPTCIFDPVSFGCRNA